MTTGPGDEMAGAEGRGRGRLRAGHADREQVIGTLKAAYVAGVLAKDEFDLRVGQTFASRTCADLAAITADLPAGLAPAPGPARARSGQPILRPGPVVTWATVLYAAVWAFNGKGLVVLAGVVYLAIVAVSVSAALENRRDMRSGGQLPRGRAPGAGGQASRRLPSADPGRRLPPAGPGHRHTAEAAPAGRPRLLPS